MKLYISVDMEGATGIVNPSQVRAGSSEYAFGCRMQEHDLLAAIDGALKGGAKEIIVNDAHSRMINLDINSIPEGVRLTSGSPKELGMMEGIDGCDAAFFMCYHAMAGTEKAILDHTVDPETAHRVRLNGRECGELGLNAALCSSLDIPVIFSTGDMALCREAEAFLGSEVTTVPVKTGRGQFCGDILPPVETWKKIRQGAMDALKVFSDGSRPSYNPGLPFELEITFQFSSQCDAVSTVPGSIRTDGRTLAFRGDSFRDMRRWISIALDLAETVEKW